jgi:signal peptidase I
MKRRAALDHRVKKEARALLAEAKRGVSARSKLPTQVVDELRTRMGAVETALAAGDLDRVRLALPPLDSLVDEHLTPGRKSTSREYGESITIAIVIALLLRSFVIEAFKIPSASMIPTMEIGDHIFVNKFLYGIRIPFTKTKLFEWRKPERGEVIVFMNPCTPEKDFIKRVVALAGDTVEVRCDILYVNGVAVPHELVAEDDCEYYDVNEGETVGSMKRCSRYQEKVADNRYDTLHDASRPSVDRERDRRNAERGLDYAQQGHDFPETDLSEPRFICNAGDQRTDEERAQSLGTFGSSVTPGDEPGVCEPRLHYVVPPGHVFAMGDNRSNSSDSRTWGPVPLGHIKGKALFIWWSHTSGNDRGVRLDRMGRIVH